MMHLVQICTFVTINREENHNFS